MDATLADTYANRYSFIDEEFAETICQVLEIERHRLIKPKRYKSLMVKLPNLLLTPFIL